MKTIINRLNNLTGWAVSDPAVTIVGLNDFAQYCADYQPKSVILGFNKANGKWAELTLPSPVNNGKLVDITFCVWSRNLGGDVYRVPADFKYAVDFGTGIEYYLPVGSTFGEVTVRLPANSSITKLRIKALTDEVDNLIVSNLLISKDDMPLDILVGSVEGLNAILSPLFPIPNSSLPGIKVGSTTLAVGAKFFTLPLPHDFLDKYAKVLITDGTNTEIHHIDRMTNDPVTGAGPYQYYFGNLSDGKLIINDFSAGCDVYLVLDVGFGKSQEELVLPSITVWGFNSGFQYEATEQWEIDDTFKVMGEVDRRRVGQIVRWNLLIDCESRNYELIQYMAKAVRDFIVNNPFWVNGRRLDAGADGPANEIEPNEAFGIIPKVQYPVYVEVREESWQRTTLVRTTQINQTIQLQ